MNNKTSAVNKDLEMESGVSDDSLMLKRAEEYIQKLTNELKEKEHQIQEHVRRWQFYEQIVKTLTTFK
jgi:hypothetical protein